MLDTIYEADEDGFPDENLTELTVKPFRLPYYICWSIIAGCFLSITLIIAFSLNPFCASAPMIHKNPRHIMNVPLNKGDKVKISKEINNHLDNFANQVNDEVGLQPDTITFLTSIFSDSSLEYKSEDDALLWIYFHLKYPQSCIADIQCTDKLHSKLIMSFMKLSNLLTMINLDGYNNKEIQLDWCNLMNNSTSVTLVSLVYITMINQSATEINARLERGICESIDHSILLSKAIASDDLMIDNMMRETYPTDFNKNRIKDEEEINLTCTNALDCSTYSDIIDNQRQETSDYSNDRNTYFHVAWNSI